MNQRPQLCRTTRLSSHRHEYAPALGQAHIRNGARAFKHFFYHVLSLDRLSASPSRPRPLREPSLWPMPRDPGQPLLERLGSLSCLRHSSLRSRWARKTHQHVQCCLDSTHKPEPDPWITLGPGTRLPEVTAQGCSKNGEAETCDRVGSSRVSFRFSFREMTRVISRSSAQGPSGPEGAREAHTSLRISLGTVPRSNHWTPGERPQVQSPSWSTRP